MTPKHVTPCGNSDCFKCYPETAMFWNRHPLPGEGNPPHAAMGCPSCGSRTPEEEWLQRQCPERCLGVEGHGGYHQTSDEDEIRYVVRTHTVRDLRLALDDLHDDAGPTHQCGKACFQTLLDRYTGDAP